MNSNRSWHEKSLDKSIIVIVEESVVELSWKLIDKREPALVIQKGLLVKPFFFEKSKLLRGLLHKNTSKLEKGLLSYFIALRRGLPKGSPFNKFKPLFKMLSIKRGDVFNFSQGLVTYRRKFFIWRFRRRQVNKKNKWMARREQTYRLKVRRGRCIRAYKKQSPSFTSVSTRVLFFKRKRLKIFFGKKSWGKFNYAGKKWRKYGRRWTRRLHRLSSVVLKRLRVPAKRRKKKRWVPRTPMFYRDKCVRRMWPLYYKTALLKNMLETKNRKRKISIQRGFWRRPLLGTHRWFGGVVGLYKSAGKKKRVSLSCVSSYTKNKIFGVVKQPKTKRLYWRGPKGPKGWGLNRVVKNPVDYALDSGRFLQYFLYNEYLLFLTTKRGGKVVLKGGKSRQYVSLKARAANRKNFKTYLETLHLHFFERTLKHSDRVSAAVAWGKVVSQFLYVSGQMLPWYLKYQARQYSWYIRDHHKREQFRRRQDVYKIKTLFDRIMVWLYQIFNIRYVWGKLAHALRQSTQGFAPNAFFYKKDIKIRLS